MTAFEMRISDWCSDVCSSDLMVRDYGGRAFELDLAGLQTDIGIMPARLLSVLEATKTWLAQGGGDPSSLYDVFQAAEARKGARARLSQTPNGRDRRAE